MKSANASHFDHDPLARRYDTDILDESHPIRAGYSAALSWMGSCVAPGSRVLDLGSGTGNSIACLPPGCLATAVDISGNMLGQARVKLSALRVEYVKSDMLQFLGSCPAQRYDAVVSSYAIHHLTDDEKQQLFPALGRCLIPGGRAVFVDLMFRNTKERQTLAEKYRGNREVTDSFEEEFYWDIELSLDCLKQSGFRSVTRRFSDLSWGILATLGA